MSTSSAQTGWEDKPAARIANVAQADIEFPLIALDRGRRGPNCIVKFCQSSLINTYKPTQRKPCKKLEWNGTPVIPYNFNGTCGKRSVRGVQYWQATLIATSLVDGQPLRRNSILAELGVASREALKAAQNSVAPSKHAIALQLKLEQNYLLGQVLGAQHLKLSWCQAGADLDVLEWTCGFFADGRSGHLVILDVISAKILDIVRLPPGELYPFFNVVHPVWAMTAEIAIHLKCVEENLFSPDMRSLLWRLTKHTADLVVGDLGIVVDTNDSDNSDDDDDYEDNGDAYHDEKGYLRDAGSYLRNL